MPKRRSMASEPDAEPHRRQSVAASPATEASQAFSDADEEEANDINVQQEPADARGRAGMYLII